VWSVATNRRNFLGMMVGGVAAAAAVRTFPFRVFSFPKEVQIPKVDSRTVFCVMNPVNLDVRGYLPHLPWYDDPTGTFYGIQRKS
jgi:hypothetical protein